jgi:outer membrane lipoprotein-sorting protein
MFRRLEWVCIFLFLPLSLAAGADLDTARLKLSAAQIVDKNVSARGGLAAWRSVQSLAMTGKMEAGGNNRPTLEIPGDKNREAALPPPRPTEQVQLPFTMELKRPRKTRLELQFNGQTAVQVYDGTNGWKLRPFLNRHEVEPYNQEEMASASMQADLDGPLVDYAAKGTKIEFEGMERVGDQDTYKLRLTLKNGKSQNVWIDSQTYLEVKIEGTPRRLDGKYRDVATYYSDYRMVNHLMLPYALETAVDGVEQTEKIQIDSISVNPKVSDSRFARLQ